MTTKSPRIGRGRASMPPRTLRHEQGYGRRIAIAACRAYPHGPVCAACTMAERRDPFRKPRPLCGLAWPIPCARHHLTERTTRLSRGVSQQPAKSKSENRQNCRSLKGERTYHASGFRDSIENGIVKLVSHCFPHQHDLLVASFSAF